MPTPAPSPSPCPDLPLGPRHAGLAAIRRIDRLTTHTPTADEPLAASTYANAPLRGFLPITPIENPRAPPGGDEGEKGETGDEDLQVTAHAHDSGDEERGEAEGADDELEERRPRKGARASARADEPTWEERLKALSNVRSTLASTDCLLASIEGRHDGAESPCGTESPCSSWERLVSRASVASAARRAEVLSTSARDEMSGAACAPVSEDID